jgi:ABC-type nickel/cobalt efflux system permease component RcnA
MFTLVFSTIIVIIVAIWSIMTFTEIVRNDIRKRKEKEEHDKRVKANFVPDEIP